MSVNLAKLVLYKNANCSENSLVYDLYERGRFSKKRFREFYDCVITLAKDARKNGKDFDTAAKITGVYQRILKEMLRHFDKNDASSLKKFPQKYNEYIERLDYAVNAYFSGKFADEDRFSLKRK